MIEKIIIALQRIEKDKGKTFFYSGNSKKFNALLSDYLPGSEYENARKIFYNLCKCDSLRDIDLEDSESIRKMLEANEYINTSMSDENTVKCPNCHRINIKNANFCSNCGSKLNINDSCCCTKCGNKIAKGDKFCPKCGNRIEEQFSEPEYEKLLLDELIVLENKNHAPEIQEILGDRYYEKKQVPKAFRWYRESATQGRSSAQYKLAKIYENEKKWKNAFDWYLKAAKQDNAEAQYSLGTFYFCGDGVKKDKREAYEWTLKAAKLGHSMAQCHIAESYYWGINCAVDYKRAFEWLSKSVKGKTDFGKPFYLLGECYRFGHGTEENLNKAFNLYNQADTKQYIPGTISLASCYLNGIGVEKDEKKAFSLLNNIKENERFTKHASFGLGLMLFLGCGCVKNEELGWRYLKEADNFQAGCFMEDRLAGEEIEWDEEEEAYIKKGSSSTISVECSGWSLENGKLTVWLEEVKNCSYWDTGSLVLTFWYSDEPYTDGHLDGTEMGECKISESMDPYECKCDIKRKFKCKDYPSCGDKYHIVTINELHEDGSWYIVGHYNFGTTNWDD